MSQQSKFAGVFSHRDQPAPMQPGRAEEPPPARRGGRPTGKKSDPAYTARNVLTRNDLHEQATDILRREKQGQDFSDLVNLLLQQWLEAKRPSGV